MTALIISGGDYSPVPDLSWDYAIACDRGYLHAKKMGICPDLILGDFDSAPVPDGTVPVEQHPVRKDDTDTMLAVRKALSLGYTDLVIAYAFGGRLDHAYANIQAGAFAAELGAVVRLCGIDTEAWVFCDRTLEFPRRTGYTFSVFSVSDSCSVAISGAEYECDNLLILNNYPIGISNEWKADRIAVSADGGVLLVMECGEAKGK